jgi:hypothetical protein
MGPNVEQAIANQNEAWENIFYKLFDGYDFEKSFFLEFCNF